MSNTTSDVIIWKHSDSTTCKLLKTPATRFSAPGYEIVEIQTRTNLRVKVVSLTPDQLEGWGRYPDLESELAPYLETMPEEAKVIVEERVSLYRNR